MCLLCMVCVVHVSVPHVVVLHVVFLQRDFAYFAIVDNIIVVCIKNKYVHTHTYKKFTHSSDSQDKHKYKTENHTVTYL